MENDGMDAFAKDYALGPTRVQLQNKDPRGWADEQGLDLGPALSSSIEENHMLSTLLWKKRSARTSTPLSSSDARWTRKCAVARPSRSEMRDFFSFLGTSTAAKQVCVDHTLRGKQARTHSTEPPSPR